ncbi:MAG TPA: hypothetical protein VEV17_22805 [Bryobacteraceae bacterium]|nr:hypothetical protein [Bryobacteraceae bacterium]
MSIGALRRASWQIKLAAAAKLAAVALWAAAAALAQVNVLTANYDNNRTNSNLHETRLSPQTVNPATFGKIGTFAVDGQIYAQPLYVSGVQIAGAGQRNVVYIATMHNSVYAMDADAPQNTQPLWMKNLGRPILSAVFNFTDILPEVGILSTPVIDPSQNVIYVVSDTLENQAPVFRLHALSLSDGSEQMNGPVVITASVPGTGEGSDGQGVLNLNPMFHLQRPGLALANGAVYVSFGSHADMGVWHGWLIGYDASNLQRQIQVFNTTPNRGGGSIWQGGRAPAIDAGGDIYIVTGNGDYDGVTAFGESLLRLSAPSQGQTTSLTNRGWFTPEDWAVLNDADSDFGSTGAILVPGSDLLLAGSKAGVLYVVPRGSMAYGQVDPGAAQAVQVNQWGMFDLALWKNHKGAVVYLTEPETAVKAFQMTNGQLESTPSSQFSVSGSFYTALAVSADGGRDGTGLVWVARGANDLNQVPGSLHALDASDLSNELWNSNMNADRDGLGRFAKFAAPTVANGRVYAPTFSNAVVIYGLLDSDPQDGPAPKVSAVMSGASFVGRAVAPGEVVAIFGANLGVSSFTQQQMDAGANVGTSLAGTQVLFDGVTAPLLYVSATQVGAVVPFEILGPTTQLQVVYNGQTSDTFTVPVVSAAPSLFSIDGNGGGVGVFNPDGTENSDSNPTSSGSIVTFYATGGGQTTPPSVNGAVTNEFPYPIPLLPVTVLIDGQEAEVLRAGAAPGMVAGILLVSARVPDALSGNYLQVVLKVGSRPSPNTLWLNVQ